MKKVFFTIATLFFSVFAFVPLVSSPVLVSAEHGGLHSCENDPDNPGECVPGTETEHGGEEAEYVPNIEEPKDRIMSHGVCDDGGSVPRATGLDPNQAFECDCVDAGGNLSGENCDLIRVAEIGSNILAAVGAIAVVGGIMYGGFIYMTARDNPGQLQAARTKIVWAIVALFILLFFWGFLQWLIPGGILGGGGTDVTGVDEGSIPLEP